MTFEPARAGAPTADAGPPLRSAMPGIVWPAFPEGLGMMMLALQYQFERSERLPPERIAARQFRQLALLCEHAARTIPFHRARLRAAGIGAGKPLDAAAWVRLPPMTRRDLQRHAEALRTKPPPAHGSVTRNKSSGSSGMPVEVATTALAAMLNEAISLRDHLWHGRDFAGRVAVIRRPRDGEAVDAPSAGWMRGISAAMATGGSVLCDALRPIGEQLDWLLRENPDYLITYPSILGELLREAERRQLRLPRLKSVLTQSELASRHLRERLRAIWGASLTDTYSASEAGVMALQCPHSGQYHVQSEVALVEVIDAAGQPCAPGEMGRVVVTPLHNFAQPLFRYDIGDLAEVGEPCACGRGLPTLARIIGRATAMLVLPSGAMVLPHFDTAFATAALPIIQFQVVQRSRERLEARLVVERSLEAAEEEKLRRLLLAACGAELAVDFSYHDVLPRGPGGKFAAFYSEVPHA